MAVTRKRNETGLLKCHRAETKGPQQWLHRGRHGPERGKDQPKVTQGTSSVESASQLSPPLGLQRGIASGDFPVFQGGLCLLNGLHSVSMFLGRDPSCPISNNTVLLDKNLLGMLGGNNNRNFPMSVKAPPSRFPCWS